MISKLIKSSIAPDSRPAGAGAVAGGSEGRARALYPVINASPRWLLATAEHASAVMPSIAQLGAA
jgi:hypothetical protein